MKKLVPSFKDSLFSSFSDVTTDLSELGIDTIMDIVEDNFIREIPIVKIISSVKDFVENLHDRNLLKQTLAFIKELNSGSINNDKYIAYKSTIENNPKKAEEELGRVLLILNNNIDAEKSVVLARLFKAYVNCKIDWQKFCEYSEVTNRLFVQDFNVLLKFEKEEGNSNMNYIVGRLTLTGLIVTGFEIEGGHLIQKWKLSEIGKEYASLIL